MRKAFHTIKVPFSSFFSLIMLFFPLISCSICYAESIDQVTNPKTANNTWVSDMADVIDDETEGQLNSLINSLEQSTSAEIAVVTVQTVADSTPKQFATDLFNLWKIGKKEKDNGALVLLVMDERRVEVETGYGVEGVLPDGKVGQILREQMVPRFKEGDFGKGIFDGVQVMVSVIGKEQSESGAMPDNTPSVSGSTKPKSLLVGLGILTLFLILLIIFVPISLVIYLIWRHFNVRKCSSCSQRMRKLTEQQDDAYLSSDQRLEEALGSVNYKAWRCDDCQTLKIEKAIRSQSNYDDCPKCKHRTLFIKKARLKEPTTLIEGLEEVERKCRYPNCGYQDTSKLAIPRLVIMPIASRRSSFRSSGTRRSSGGSSFSSSSSGSFGGGSSGGGGAGASW